MLKSDLIKLLEGLEDSAEIDEVLFSKDTLSKFEEESKVFRSALDSIKDSHLTKGLKTWQENHLQKYVDDEIAKRFPDETPENKELASLKAKLQEMEHQAKYKELSNEALKYATDKKLPTDVVEYFIGDDKDSTIANLDKFAEIFETSLESQVKERLGKQSYKPKGESHNEGVGDIDLMKIVTENQVQRD